MDKIKILKDLEAFRSDLESGKIHAGCPDWIVRVCQAIIVKDTFADRTEWVSLIEKATHPNVEGAQLNPMEVYRNASEGTLFRSEEGKYFCKPAQSASFHMEGMLIGLFDGDIIHYSHTMGLAPVYGHEIPW